MRLYQFIHCKTTYAIVIGDDIVDCFDIQFQSIPESKIQKDYMNEKFKGVEFGLGNFRVVEFGNENIIKYLRTEVILRELER